MSNRYIGNKWLWVAPIIPPTVHASRVVQALQVTALQAIMQLHVPEVLERPLAMAVHRLRRRAVHLFMNYHVDKSWVYMWKVRLWGYMGHVLRRSPDTPVRSVVNAMVRLKRPLGGQPNSPLDWVLRAAKEAFQTFDAPPSIFEYAWDRDAWKQAGAVHFRAVGVNGAHSRLHEQVFPRWQDALLQHADWLLNVVFLPTANGFCILWIDTTEGVMVWNILHDGLALGLWRFASHARMLYPCFAVHCSLSRASLEAYLVTLQESADDIQQHLHLILMYTVVPDEIMTKIACVMP